MILVCGTSYREGQLPYSDILKYKVVSEKQAPVAVKTLLNSNVCDRGYFHERLRDLIFHNQLDKVTFFTDDVDLRDKLTQAYTLGGETVIEEVVEEVPIEDSFDNIPADVFENAEIADSFDDIPADVFENATPADSFDEVPADAFESAVPADAFNTEGVSGSFDDIPADVFENAEIAESFDDIPIEPPEAFDTTETSVNTATAQEPANTASEPMSASKFKSKISVKLNTTKVNSTEANTATESAEIVEPVEATTTETVETVETNTVVEPVEADTVVEPTAHDIVTEAPEQNEGTAEDDVGIPMELELVDDFELLDMGFSDADNESPAVKELEEKIEELRATIAERDEKIRTVYMEMEEHDRQFEEDKQVFMDNIEELEKRCVELENAVPTGGDLSLYDDYAAQNKAVCAVDLTPDELKYISNLDLSDVYIFAFGAGESMKRLVRNIADSVVKANNLFVLDLTLDIMFRGVTIKTAIKSGYSALAEPYRDIAPSAVDFGNSKVICTGVAHDLGLLTINWGSLLANAKKAAKGRKILILLPQLTSSTVMLTMKKLCSITGIHLYVNILGDAYVVQQLCTNLQFVNSSALSILVSDCMPTAESKPLYASLKKANPNALMFKDKIDYTKTGLI